MLRSDLTANFWLEKATHFLSTADFSPPQALAAAKLALTLYQRDPTTNTNFNLAKAYAAIAEGYYLSEPMPTTGITEAILFFMRAKQVASVDDAAAITLQFNNFLARFTKDILFEAIKKSECKKTEKFLLEQCTYTNTHLGAKMYATRLGIPCQLTKGTLGKIVERIKFLEKMYEESVLRAVPAPTMPNDSIKWLEDALFYLKLSLDENNIKAALIYAEAAFLLHTPSEQNNIDTILIYYFRGLIYDRNDNLMAAINDMNKALELLAIATPENINACHLSFKRLSQQNTIETLAEDFSRMLSSHFPAHIYDAIKMNRSKTTITYLMNLCLNPNTVMGKVMHTLDNGRAVLEVMRVYLAQNTTYDANTNLFGKKNTSETIITPVKQVAKGVPNGH